MEEKTVKSLEIYINNYLEKVTVYNAQQYLYSIYESDTEFKNLSKKDRVRLLKDNLSKGKIPLISYRWESEEYNTSENKSEIKRHAHTITGIALRLVDSHEKTINGKDVSKEDKAISINANKKPRIEIRADMDTFYLEEVTKNYLI